MGDAAFRTPDRAYFRTGSFASGVAFVDAIGRLADAANHHPEVDLRYDGVTVRLRTHDNGGLSERDVELARQVSAAARELDVSADPGAVQVVQVAIDALDVPKVRQFWRAVLGYQERGDEDLDDPHSRGPSISTWPPGWVATERHDNPLAGIPRAAPGSADASR